MSEGLQPTLQVNAPHGSDFRCLYCEGECVPWESLPDTDQGDGICEWCGKAITKEWPAVAMPEGDDTVTHYHNCTQLPTEGFPHGR
jgi:hypothetical protein